MSFFFLLLCGCISTSVCVSYSKIKEIRFLFKILTFLILWIPVAIGYGTGVDYFSYQNIFNVIRAGCDSGQEKGWLLLNKTVIALGGDGQTLVAVTAFLTLFFFFEEVESKKWFIYAPVFMCVIYNWVFTTYRQMLMMAMCFNALLKLQRGAKKRAIVLFILSFYFHKSVLFYIPIACLVYFFKPSKNMCVMLFFVLYVFSKILFPRMIDFIFYVIGLTIYGGYLAGGASFFINSTTVSSGLGRLLRYFLYFCIVLCLPAGKKGMRLSVLFLFYVAMDFVSQTIMILGRLGRMCLFMYPPLTYEIFSAKKNKLFFYLMCISLLGLFYLDLVAGFHGVIPYKTIFNK